MQVYATWRGIKALHREPIVQGPDGQLSANQSQKRHYKYIPQ